MMRKNRLGLASIRCQQTETDHHQNYWAGADKAAHDNCITALQQVHSINFVSVKMHDPPPKKKIKNSLRTGAWQHLGLATPSSPKKFNLS